MVGQSIITLNKSLLELLEPSTSPEKALQLLSTSYFTPEAYSEGDKEPVVIFLSYINFVMNRQPDPRGSVQSIWEEILKKAFMYLRKDVNIKYYIEQIRDIYPRDVFSWVVPALRDNIQNWVVYILSNHTRCPNPYVTLEMFRLLLKLHSALYIYFDVRIYRSGDEQTLCNSFWYAICKVNPHRFIPIGDGYEPMFNACDLELMLVEVHDDISYEQINDLNFLSNIIRLTEVFAIRIGNDPLKWEEIDACDGILAKLLDMSDQVTCQSIQNYIVKAVREITATGIFRWWGKSVPDTFHRITLRDINVKGFALSPKPCDLPRLLLLRQVQGPRQVRQHALLLPDLAPIFSTEEKPYRVWDNLGVN